MKIKQIIMTFICITILTTFSYTFEIDLGDDIDLMSLDMLVKQGIISEEDKLKYLDKKSINKIEDADIGVTDSKVEDIDLNELYIGEFLVDSVTQLSEDSLKINFNQDINYITNSKSYYDIVKNSGEVIKKSYYDIKNIKNDKKALILKLKEGKFESGEKYELKLSRFIKSFYNVNINSFSDYKIEFEATEMSDLNDAVLEYEVYEDGHIDIKFKTEVSQKLIENKSNYRLVYGKADSDAKFESISKKLTLIEDKDGVSRTIRAEFTKFNEKYDYKLEIKALQLENNIYEFPGGSTYSESFNVEDLLVIDNHTVILTLDTKIDYSNKNGNIKLIGRASLDNFEVYDDKTIVIHMKKDAGLDFNNEYTIELSGFISAYGNALNDNTYMFLNGSSDSNEEYVEIEFLDVSWVGRNFIKLSFTKPIKFDKSAKSGTRIEDENGKFVNIKSYYQTNPSEVIINTFSGSFGDKYQIKCSSIRESGNQFKADKMSYIIE